MVLVIERSTAGFAGSVTVKNALLFSEPLEVIAFTRHSPRLSTVVSLITVVGVEGRVKVSVCGSVVMSTRCLIKPAESTHANR